MFDAFLGSRREIWIGTDGSGLIRGTGGPVSFFTDAGRPEWRRPEARRLSTGRGLTCLRPAALAAVDAAGAVSAESKDGLIAALEKHVRTLHDVQELLGEAAVEPEFCEMAYRVGCQLPDVDVVPELSDQLGRVGRGLTRVGERA